MSSGDGSARAARPVLLLCRPTGEDFAANPALDEALLRYEVLALGEDGVDALRHSGDLARVEVVVAGFEREAPRSSLPFAEMERLALVHSVIAGVDDLLELGLGERGVVLTSSAGCYAGGIAEYVVAVAICLLRRLPGLLVASSRGEWLEHSLGRELASSRIGVVGYGGIGQRVAALAGGMGSEVWSVTRSPQPGGRAAARDGGPDRDDGGRLARVSGLADLGAMLAWSDVVVVATSLNPTSRGMIGADELAVMSPASYLVNVSRGPVIDEPALLAALTEQRLAGAVLDTTDVEPLPPGHPLWHLPNVWITPHIAGGTHEGRARVAALLATNLTRYAEGRLDELENVVDIAKELGHPPAAAG
jgi:phosphoglycerate dehydrogenase-like enzyme